MIMKMPRLRGSILSDMESKNARPRKRVKKIVAPSQPCVRYNHHHQRLIIGGFMVIIMGQICNSGIGPVSGNPVSKVGFSLKRRISGSSEGKTLQEWEDIFHQRSDEDWRSLWHKEKHRRCEHNILAHMEHVCEKDIYKLMRRRRKRNVDASEINISNDAINVDNEQNIPDSRDGSSGGLPNDPNLPLTNHPLFNNFKEANLFAKRQLFQLQKKLTSQNSDSDQATEFKIKRSSQIGRYKRGISDECCSGPSGCSWEEYAEYCPANVRVRQTN